jgi:multiple sugar transport system substrate-binding protein
MAGASGSAVCEGTRRELLCTALAGPAAWLAGACRPFRTQEQAGRTEPPQRVIWSKTDAGEARDRLWRAAFEQASQATGVEVELSIEPGQGYWDKRQAEFAGGVASVDVMVNQLSWVLPGGLAGMFVDHYEYMRRDRVDLQQYYRADLDSWSWKGKLWSVPLQSGGEAVLFNRRLFTEKGVPYPRKDWRYDDLLDICRRLNDPANNRYALLIGQNLLHYMMGTFVTNFGGRLLNEQRDRALYGDDPNAIAGAEFDVALHTQHQVVPPPQALAALPQGSGAMEAQMVAMEINGLFRHISVRAAIGNDNLDVAPPPRGPTGIQTAAMAGNGWSIMALSKAREAAWKVLRWLHSREGMLGPQIQAVAWPPVIWAAQTPQWLDQFKGTGIASVVEVWQRGGRPLPTVPEGAQAWNVMNAPLQRALRGEIGTREAMQQSAAELNALFSRRPPEWR